MALKMSGSVTVQNEGTWLENSITCSWNAATGGTLKNYWFLIAVAPVGSSFPNYYAHVVNVGKVTSYTCSLANIIPSVRGWKVRASVYASATGGDSDSNEIFSSGNHRFNEKPTPPIIRTIGGKTTINGMVINCTDNIVIGGSTDTSFPAGLDYVSYGLNYGGTFLGWGGSKTDITWRPNWGLHAGKTINIFATASDAWVNSDNSTTYSIKVGDSITASAPTISTTYLNSKSTLSISQAKINGYALTVDEKITLQYSFNNSTWLNYSDLTRNVSNTDSPIIVSNILYGLSTLSPSEIKNSTSRNIYFRTIHTAGHLTNQISSVKTVYFFQPTIAAYLSADGRNFPLDNTIPIVKDSIDAHWSISGNSSYWTQLNDSYVFTILMRRSTDSYWTQVSSRTVTESVSGSYTHYMHTSSLTSAYGSIAEIKARLTLGSTIVWENNVNWLLNGQPVPNQNEVDKNRIQKRNLPSITSITTTEKNNLPFVTNLSDEKSVTTPYVIKWDMSKAFAIVQCTTTLTNAYLSNGITSFALYNGTTPYLLFKQTGVPEQEFSSKIKLKSNIDSNNNWKFDTFNIPTSSAVVSAPTDSYLLGNKNTVITYSFTIKEVYRSSIGSAPNTSLLSGADVTESISFNANTFCNPIFPAGTITYQRVKL